VDPTCRVTIPYIKGLPQKSKRIGNMFNIKNSFKTRNTIGSILRKLKPKKDLMDKPQCVDRIPCDWGRKNTGETSRPPGTRLKEHKYNLRLEHVEKSKLTAHTIEEGHRIVWDKQTLHKLNQIVITENTRKQHVMYQQSDQPAKCWYFIHLVFNNEKRNLRVMLWCVPLCWLK
jgi:hypothetical protein